MTGIYAENYGLIKTPFSNSVITENIAMSYSVGNEAENIGAASMARYGLRR
jgi:hypothetical protein